MTLAPGYGYAAKALQRLHRKLSITVVDGAQQMIFQRVAVLQHLDAEDGIFRQRTLPWQIDRFGGKICVVYPVVRKVLQLIGAKLVYNLDKKTLAQMETELKEKRG